MSPSQVWARWAARWPVTCLDAENAFSAWIDSRRHTRAGILFPEICVEAHLTMARKHGADLRSDEPVLSWADDGDGVRVVTSKGAYHSGQLVLTAGSWIHSLLGDLKLPLAVERQVQF